MFVTVLDNSVTRVMHCFQKTCNGSYLDCPGGHVCQIC